MTKKKDIEESAIVVGKLDGIVETKLSKSEVINLIIDDIEAKCRVRISEIDVEQQNLAANLPKDKVRKLVFEYLTFSVHLGHSYDQTVSIRTGVGRLPDDLPTWLLEARDRHRALDLERTQLNKVRQAMQEKDKARNYILRHSLSSSDEGRDLMKVIENFSIGLHSQLLLVAGGK